MGRKNDQYLEVASTDDSQDITSHGSPSASNWPTDLELVPFDSPPSSSPPSYLHTRRNDTWRSGDSSATQSSKYSVSSGFEKLKDGWANKRLPSVPRYAQGSIRRHPAAEIEPTRIGRGVWKDQLLVDRSLRTMALTMSLFAVSMVILVCVYAGPFGSRPNKFTSSVGGDTRSCKEVKNMNAALLLLINIAGTMVLGMSNTYQQLITSLTVRDIKPALEKLGDSRVGTNSPFNINRKSFGKKRAWAAWTLLVFTSLPIHFLANSLIGPSYVMSPPGKVEYNITDTVLFSSQFNSGYNIYSASSFVCWSALRAGKAHYAREPFMMKREDTAILGDTDRPGTYFDTITVTLPKSCERLKNTTTDIDGLEHYLPDSTRFGESKDECALSEKIKCYLKDPVPVKCRLNVRMSAAFVLMAGLVVKAIYMVTVNILARGHRKEQLLTFGDVIVASASNPDLRIQGECMVNARESYRRLNKHTCHKHCRNKVESMTGDEIGHCQSCKTFNSTNKLSNKPQPVIATKIKRSLITNLGNTALAQMCIMIFTALFLLAGSIMAAVGIATEAASTNEYCNNLNRSPWYGYNKYRELCATNAAGRVGALSGGWGGINQSVPIANLPMDSFVSEVGSFAISNGAQFIYSLLYLMFLYNITLISQEHSFGKLEHTRKRLRTTIVRGEGFSEDYLLQLPKKILIPTMVGSILIHWLLGEALHTQESIWLDKTSDRYVEHSGYTVAYAAYPLWCATAFVLIMTGVCRWAFTYRREGFIPQMFGSIRVLCAATTQLDDFPADGIKWGDLGEGERFRHAGLSGEEVLEIVPFEPYA
ncbi:hypothetical protein DM02DRAFT_649430 [Periconia macrospinosa]|uniref:DUF6536 domain-containing protein n=1 Tax=Periconia macrospinosa TaxID=97972 RepID=A0A2V1E840_9PLEO|nr:hypothetical protein DM02DRAFT_649430 [Periconia macrospinosa]